MLRNPFLNCFQWLSFLTAVGMIATTAVYYPWAKATNRSPPETIYPDSNEAVLSHS